MASFEAVLPPRFLRIDSRWLIMAVILCAEILDMMDATITSLAAPEMAADLGGGHGLIQWLSSSYMLSMGVLLFVGARCGDKFGRSRMFMIGLAGFTVASLGVGLAWSPLSIIVGRLIQGAFGALMLPQGFAILTAIFNKEERGKSFAAFGPVMGISMVFGPMLAGWMLHANLLGLEWRPLFLINIVLGSVGLIAAKRLLPKQEELQSVSIDWFGAAAIGLAMLGMLSGLISGSEQGWTTWAFAQMLFGAAMFAVFVWRQRTATEPLIAPSLLNNRGFTNGLIVGGFVFAALGGMMMVSVLYMLMGVHFNSLETAIANAPLSLGIGAGAVIGGRLINQWGRKLLVVGLSTLSVGLVGYMALVHSRQFSIEIVDLIIPFLVMGVGLGITFGSVSNIAMGDIEVSEAGSATGAFNSLQQLASAVGNAVTTTLFFRASLIDDLNGTFGLCLVVVLATVLVSIGLTRFLPKYALAEEPMAV